MLAWLSTLKSLVNFFLTLGIVGDGEIHKAMMYALADKEINTVIVCGSFYIMP
jgi:hypothetical protein